MSGDVWIKDAYCRRSCVLRNSGRLWDGGWVGGYLCMGGTGQLADSIDGAGVTAAAAAAEAHRHCRN